MSSHVQNEYECKVIFLLLSYFDTFLSRDLCITLILAKIWEFTIDFIVKNLMKFANIELCRGLIS
jgi:hypothetical protein